MVWINLLLDGTAKNIILTSLLLVKNNPFIAYGAAVYDRDSITENVSGLGVLEVRVSRCGKGDRNNPIGVH